MCTIVFVASCTVNQTTLFLKKSCRRSCEKGRVSDVVILDVWNVIYIFIFYLFIMDTKLAFYPDWTQSSCFSYTSSVWRIVKKDTKVIRRDSSIISTEFIKSPCLELYENYHDLGNSENFSWMPPFWLLILTGQPTAFRREGMNL